MASCDAGGGGDCGGGGGGGDSGGGGYDSSSSGSGGNSLPQYFYISSESGVYSGSLSSQGNMTAMQLNPGGYKYYDAISGQDLDINSTAPNYGFDPRVPVEVRLKPYLTGYIREYWRDPTTCTFGSLSAMPALTGVMPAEFTSTPGNFNFYVDLQITRLLKQQGFDFSGFYNTLNQAISWVTTSNSYLAGLKNAENFNLNYYGFNSYDDLITQGFNKYKNSSALLKAFQNIGSMVQYIPEEHFGTSNQVAKALIDNGLGSISNLSERLYSVGVIYSDIYNPNYTATISSILASITNTADLAVIQAVIGSTIPDMVSPLDYTSISGASGRSNDSGFGTLGEVGRDLYLRAPGSNFTTGADVALLIEQIQNESSPVIENLSTNNSLLTPEIIASLRSFLPVADGNNPVSVVEVIGTASGYLTPYIKNVNEGLAQLLATPYGPQIRQLLTDIGRYASGIAITQDEANAAASYTPVPPPQRITTTNSDGGSTESIVPGTGGPGYWTLKCLAAQDQYFALLDQLVADTSGDIPAIVRKINDNYYQACKLLNIENGNFTKANINVFAYNDPSQYLSFVSSLPGLAADEQNIGTDYLLFGITQDNDNGNLVRTVMGQAKNEYFMSNAGVRIKGVV